MAADDDNPFYPEEDNPWNHDPTEDCEAHAGIECEGGCPCRKDCCMNEEDDVE